MSPAHPRPDTERGRPTQPAQQDGRAQNNPLISVKLIEGVFSDV